jgi:3-dehydroquinate synthase
LGDPLLASVFDRLNEQRTHRVAVFLDSGLSEARPAIIDEIKEYFHAHGKTLELASGPTIVPGGEGAKNGWKPIRDILWSAGNIHLDRQSFVLAIGGGAMLDAVGFAASLIHRGVRVVRMPSTVLAQNDAGVGVKTSMDEHGQKNFLGTFAPPFAVVNDLSLLETLTDRDWTGGIAEAFKVAIIKDADFFEFLCDNACELKNRDAAVMETLIRRCAVIHLDHISTAGDPFETGSARPLDFGHWSAHKLETMSDYGVGHGQAVAVGIALDSYYAMHEKLITPEQFERILDGLTKCGLPIYLDYLSRETAGELDILTGLSEFREHLGGRLNVTLPDGLGAKCELHHLEGSIITEAIEYLRARNDK